MRPSIGYFVLIFIIGTFTINNNILFFIFEVPIIITIIYDIIMGALIFIYIKFFLNAIHPTWLCDYFEWHIRPRNSENGTCPRCNKVIIDSKGNLLKVKKIKFTKRFL